MLFLGEVDELPVVGEAATVAIAEVLQYSLPLLSFPLFQFF